MLTQSRSYLSGRWLIRSATGMYLAAFTIIGCKSAYCWTEDVGEAVHVGTKAAAKALSDLCNLGGSATLPIEMP